MTVHLDRSADSLSEQQLMERLRSGAVAPTDVARHVPRFFLKIQVQTVSPCNASCVMCPWPSTKDLPQGAMSDDVFAAIVDQLAGRGVERTSLFLNNEPLLDRKLPARTALVKQRLPATSTVIYTNGQLLDERTALALADAGMDELNVSVNGLDRETFERWMHGVDYDRVMANLERLAVLQAAGRLGATKVRIAVLDLPGARDGIDAFSARTGFAVSKRPTTNQTGAIDVEGLGVQHKLDPRPFACQRPFVKAYVLFNGDMVLCNCDWRRTTIFGNVMDRTLEQMWHGAQLTAIRAAHVARSFPRDLPCATCDYPYLR
jgi:sulfatase maturation enzyme AslB (radical SAM superfamily)